MKLTLRFGKKRSKRALVGVHQGPSMRSVEMILLPSGDDGPSPEHTAEVPNSTHEQLVPVNRLITRSKELSPIVFIA